MESIYCVSIVKTLNTPIFVALYVQNRNYTADTILTILEVEELNTEIGTSHAFEYCNLKYLMHFISSDELICVVSTKNYKSRLLIQCIDEIKNNYKTYSPNNHNCLKSLCEKYNSPDTIDILAKTQNKINEVTSVMHRNIELSLQNCQKLDELEESAQRLQSHSGLFRDRAKELKKKMWWKNIKMQVTIGLILLLIVGVIVGILCALYSQNN